MQRGPRGPARILQRSEGSTGSTDARSALAPCMTPGAEPFSPTARPDGRAINAGRQLAGLRR